MCKAITNDKRERTELVMYKFELAHFSKQSEIIQEKHLQYVAFLPNCSGGIDSGLVQLGLYSLKKKKK